MNYARYGLFCIVMFAVFACDRGVSLLPLTVSKDPYTGGRYIEGKRMQPETRNIQNKREGEKEKRRDKESTGTLLVRGRLPNLLVPFAELVSPICRTRWYRLPNSFNQQKAGRQRNK